MPPITRWMLKTSLVYFLLGLLVGLVQAIGPLLANSRPPALGLLEPVRIHLFVIGWLTLLIFGVALWMFPKYSQEKPRGPVGWGWTAYGLLNGGLILRIIGESAGQPGSFFGWLLVISAVLLWLAGLLLFISLWPRIKEK